jgi:hypothetical protein
MVIPYDHSGCSYVIYFSESLKSEWVKESPVTYYSSFVIYCRHFWIGIFLENNTVCTRVVVVHMYISGTSTVEDTVS